METELVLSKFYGTTLNRTIFSAGGARGKIRGDPGIHRNEFFFQRHEREVEEAARNEHPEGTLHFRH